MTEQIERNHVIGFNLGGWPFVSGPGPGVFFSHQLYRVELDNEWRLSVGYGTDASLILNVQDYAIDLNSVKQHDTGGMVRVYPSILFEKSDWRIALQPVLAYSYDRIRIYEIISGSEAKTLFAEVGQQFSFGFDTYIGYRIENRVELRLGGGYVWASQRSVDYVNSLGQPGTIKLNSTDHCGYCLKVTIGAGVLF